MNNLSPAPSPTPNQNPQDQNQPNPNQPDDQTNTDPAQGQQNDPNAPNWDIMDTVPEFESLKIGLVNQDEEAKDRARFEAENNLAEEISHGNIIQKIWKGKLFKNKYRQDAIKRARDDMEEAKSIVLNYNEDERRKYNQSVCKAFVSEVDGVIDKEAGDERESLLEKNPELHARVSDIIKGYADGTIADPEEASRQFDEAIKDLETQNNKFGEGHLAISNIREVAIEARARYDKLMNIAEATKSKLEHDDAMERVMAGFDLYYGSRKTDHLEPKYNKTDKIIDKIQNTKFGSIIPTEVLCTAAGIATSLTEMGSATGIRMGLRHIIPGLGAVGAAAISGAKESAEFEREHYRATYDERYNREYDETDKKREKILDTIHEHHNAGELMASLEDHINEIKDLKNQGKNVDEKQNNLINEVARLKTYLDMEKTGRPVLSYTSELDAPDEQLSLLVHFANAKEFLKNNGVNDIDDKLSEQSDIMQDITEEIEANFEEKDKAAKKLKRNRIIKRAITSGAMSAVAGVAAQEVKAIFSPNLQGIFEKGGADNYSERLTACKKLANMITGKNGISFNASNQDGSIVEKAKDLDFLKSEDGTYKLMHGGKEVAKGIDWDAKTGKMTKASIKMLREQGIDVKKAGSLDFTETVNQPATRTETISFSEYIQNNVQKVRRAFWYDNNTSGVFDQNELGCHYYTDNAGHHGFVTNMLDSGSVHGDKQAVFSQLAGEGKIKLLISATDETQSTPIEVVGKMLPDGQLSFVPEEGSVAEQFFDANGNFTGRFAEVVQDLGTDPDGTNVVAPLATAVGNGFTPHDIINTVATTEAVTEHLNIPEYVFNIHQETEFPMLFPVISHSKPMRESKISKYVRERIYPENRGYGYDYNGYGYDYNGYGNDHNQYYQSSRTEAGFRITERDPDHSKERERLKWMGNISEKVFERKELQLGEETARYRRELFDARGEDYMNHIDEQIKKSDVLKNLNNDVKTIVTIPVHAPSEYETIYDTLSLYSQQEGVDPNSFVIVLDVNWRKTEKGKPSTVQKHIRRTKAEIERARRDFPNLKIATFEQTGHQGIGDVSKMLNDVTLMSIDKAIKDGRMQENNDVICIRNDADMLQMSKNYIAAYQKAMNENKKTPIFTGTSWFNIDRTKEAPGFASVCMVERMMNLFQSTVEDQPFTEGRNFAYRASHFAAVNGFGFDDDGNNKAGSDDLAVGQRINAAFGRAFDERHYTSGNPTEKNIADPSSRLAIRVGGATISSDDTRALEFYDDKQYTILDVYMNTAKSYNNNPIGPDPHKFDNYSEDLRDPQQLNHTINEFEYEMSAFWDQLAPWGRRGEYIDRVLRWWLGGPANEMYQLKDGANGHKTFTLTAKGRIAYIKSLKKHMGTGRSVNDRNPLQHAITTGEYVSPTTP